MARINRYCLMLILVLVWGSLVPSYGDAAPPAEVIRAAQSGLPSLLEAIPMNSLTHFGFDTPARLDHCKLGTGLPVHIVQPETVLADGQTQEINFLDTDIWIFPVCSEDTYTVLLTVAFHNGYWQAVDLGAAPLAADLEAALSVVAHPNPGLVRIPQAGAVFLQPDIATYDLLVPIGGTDILLGLRETSDPPEYNSVATGDALTQLRSLVADNLSATAVQK